jgi:hypothetical protein
VEHRTCSRLSNQKPENTASEERQKPLNPTRPDAGCESAGFPSRAGRGRRPRSASRKTRQVDSERPQHGWGEGRRGAPARPATRPPTARGRRMARGGWGPDQGAPNRREAGRGPQAPRAPQSRPQDCPSSISANARSRLRARGPPRAHHLLRLRLPSASGSPAPGGAGGGPPRASARWGKGATGEGQRRAGGPRPRFSPGGGSLRLTRCPPPPVAAGEWGQVRPPNACSLLPRRRRPLRPLFIKLFCLVVQPMTRPPRRAPGLASALR